MKIYSHHNHYDDIYASVWNVFNHKNYVFKNCGFTGAVAFYDEDGGVEKPDEIWLNGSGVYGTSCKGVVVVFGKDKQTISGCSKKECKCCTSPYKTTNKKYCETSEKIL